MLGIFPKSVKIGLKALSFKPTHLVPETGLEPVRCCHHGILSVSTYCEVGGIGMFLSIFMGILWQNSLLYRVFQSVAKNYSVQRSAFMREKCEKKDGYIGIENKL